MEAKHRFRGFGNPFVVLGLLREKSRGVSSSDEDVDDDDDDGPAISGS